MGGAHINIKSTRRRIRSYQHGRLSRRKGGQRATSRSVTLKAGVLDAAAKGGAAVTQRAQQQKETVRRGHLRWTLMHSNFKAAAQCAPRQ